MRDDADVQRGGNPGEAVESGPDRGRVRKRRVVEELELGRAVPEAREKSGYHDQHRVEVTRGNRKTIWIDSAELRRGE